MLNFGMIAAGFASVMTLQGLFYIALGTFVGIIFEIGRASCRERV